VSKSLVADLVYPTEK